MARRETGIAPGRGTGGRTDGEPEHGAGNRPGAGADAAREGGDGPDRGPEGESPDRGPEGESPDRGPDERNVEDVIQSATDEER